MEGLAWLPGSFCTEVEVLKARCRVLENSFGSMQKSSSQGLTLVHFSSQLKRSLWYRGCV